MSNPLALVIDDEPDICELLAITLERMSITAETCGDVHTAKKLMDNKTYNLCLTDMRLPDGDGLELVDWMQEQGLTTPVAVITAHGNVESAVRALKSGAFDFISKPLDLNELRNIVSKAMQLDLANEGEARLLGESAVIDRIRQIIAKVARSQAPVHITGESGTGKELVARMIHEQGARSKGSFITVNCGAIPSELMESEFFGHRKGSFTGAIADKQGLFQLADGGTLFLDEIAELPLPMQVKLLRVIQEKNLRPIGGTEEISVDVRILSATHHNLEELVAAGQFREDLFYRVNVIDVQVPPLRARGNDVTLLSEHILARMSQDLQIAVPVLSDAARQKLLNYGFPGNVRELENVLERAVTLCHGQRIQADEIQIKSAPEEVAEPLSQDLGGQLEDLERDTIIKALEECRYNKTAAARKLGLSLRALRYRIQKLEIE
ncbi:MAG: sigma-54-dependent transcriptional regulator [Gammaproteobacteria bacterium]